jgi:hypothetical protein
MGTYPIFIFTTHPYHTLNDDIFAQFIDDMIQALRVVVSPPRVYSVFAPEPLTRTFVDLWTQMTGIQSYQEPYYAAKLSYCTAKTFVNRSTTTFPGLTFDLRPAVEADIPAAALLCYGFAADSVSAVYRVCFYTNMLAGAFCLDDGRSDQRSHTPCP